MNLNVNDILMAFFSTSTFGLLYTFLAAYFLSYIIILLFFNTTANQEGLPEIRANILNIIIFGFLFLSTLSSYSNLTDTDKNNYLHDKLEDTKYFFENEINVFSVTSFIIGFYTIIYFLKIPMANEIKPLSISFIDSIAWMTFITFIICIFFTNFLNISIIDFLLSGKLLDELKPPTADVSNNSDNSGNKQKDEVFNISNNLYTYEDAQTVCSIYGAKVATYDQVENAYNNGGEWCNYGWSDGQMALFPTQKSTWSKLQGSEETKNNCGRPGVNGGYMENPSLLFGVNCYGQKPKPTKTDNAYMAANKEVIIPKSSEDVAVNLKAEIWKNNPDKFLILNSFNKNEWND
jgi:hypothetical protein